VVTLSSLSGDGKTLVTVEHGKMGMYGPESDATVSVGNVDTGAKLQEFKSEQVVTSSSLSGDGKTLVTVEHGEINGPYPEGDAVVTLRNVDTGAKLQEFKSEQPVTSMSLSGDGKTPALSQYLSLMETAQEEQHKGMSVVRSDQ
jgi:WD40 repeat protein